MVKFHVKEEDGTLREIEVPTDMNLNLMEVLKASDYDIEAACGGMALCATCHIEVLEGAEKLNGKTDAELDMLDTLPVVLENSRLACQIKISESLQDVVLRLNNR
ncbi:2Fe-2S iron-sulfur cluster-binding protein [Chryseosolibacter indicus]|uniref:(2Fe-2S)-binding protein n=1 Tax=Chryseosolibacter indicus TaxID=2782351 RepID=A0ABS5VV12_9BACT|nr:2Fe-2S iron-sulfur cluster-binding protein [Chryseosolibacter indicus]MBT1705264.1 (2Fe-2S)-binding protein [Chryseosolibacter indicus]